MKKVIVAMLLAVVIVIVAIVATDSQTSPEKAPLVSHTIHPTPAVMSALQAAFLAYKLHYKSMATTDRITWGQVLENGPNQPDIAFDDVDNREWAIASFNLVLPASYKAEVSFQDGGNTGIFYKKGSDKWVMTGSPGFPLCKKDVPKAVADLMGLKNYPACS